MWTSEHISAGTLTSSRAAAIRVVVVERFPGVGVVLAGGRSFSSHVILPAGGQRRSVQQYDPAR